MRTRDSLCVANIMLNDVVKVCSVMSAMANRPQLVGQEPWEHG
jgi:hypothetical protein